MSDARSFAPCVENLSYSCRTICDEAIASFKPARSIVMLSKSPSKVSSDKELYDSSVSHAGKSAGANCAKLTTEHDKSSTAGQVSSRYCPKQPSSF